MQPLERMNWVLTYMVCLCVGVLLGLYLPEQPVDSYRRGYCAALHSIPLGDSCVVRTVVDSVSVPKIHNYR